MVLCIHRGMMWRMRIPVMFTYWIVFIQEDLVVLTPSVLSVFAASRSFPACDIKVNVRKSRQSWWRNWSGYLFSTKIWVTQKGS